MNAIYIEDYGNSDQLKLVQTLQPEPQEDEVLVRVHTAGVNPVDWKIRAGMFRRFMPSTFPYIPGADLAGIVEKVGPGVTAFKIGQEVFGRGFQGSYAEYVLAPVKTLALKPRELAFDEAATIAVGATTA